MSQSNKAHEVEKCVMREAQIVKQNKAPCRLFRSDLTRAGGLTSLLVASVSFDACISIDPVYFPSLSTIFGEGLFGLSRVRGNCPDGEPHQHRAQRGNLDSAATRQSLTWKLPTIPCESLWAMPQSGSPPDTTNFFWSWQPSLSGTRRRSASSSLALDTRRAR